MLPRCQPSRQERVLFSGGRSPPTKRFACRQILPIVTISTHPDDQPAAGAGPVRDGDDDEFFTHSGGKDAEKEFHGSGILE